MLTLSTIQMEWDKSKILLTHHNIRLLQYILPRYGFFIQRIDPIIVAPEWSTGCNPAIITIRTEDTSRIAEFIRDHPKFRAFRVFKHADLPVLYENSTHAFLCNVALNMLGLHKGKTFRIVCDDKHLRQMMYTTATMLNEKYKLGCSFDYDEYDYTMEIRVYTRTTQEYNKYALISIITGKGMPNSWTYKEAEGR